MAPTTDPVFVSPARPPRESIDTVESSSKAHQSLQYGAIPMLPRGRSSRDSGDESATTNDPLQLQEEVLIMPQSIGNTSVVPGPSYPDALPLSTSPTFPSSLAHQSAVQLPPKMAPTRTPPPQYFDQIQSGIGYGLCLNVPLRNRRMTSPARLYRPRPQPTSLGASSTIQPSLSSPSYFIRAIVEGEPISCNNMTGFRIRNPADLLEVICAHPEETFTNIRALGNENIRLKHEVFRFKQEIEQNREREMLHAQGMSAKIQEMFDVQDSMQSTLKRTIIRLENEVCRLRGGGQIMQGVWLNDGESAAVSQAVFEGKTTWDQYIQNRVKAFKSVSGQALDGSGEGDDADERGKQKPGWNPNAQAFIPSVAGSSSPNKSDITELSSRVVPSPGRSSAAGQPNIDRASTPSPIPLHGNIDVKFPPTYASVLQPQPLQQPSSRSFAPGPNSVPASQYPPLSSPTASASTQQPRSRSAPKCEPSSSHAPTYAETLQSQAPNPNQSMSDAVLARISDALPPSFRIICPFSLTGLEPCPRTECKMKRLCREYNCDDSSQTNDDNATQGDKLYESNEEVSPQKQTSTTSNASNTPRQGSRASSGSHTPRKESTQSWYTPRKRKGKRKESTSPKKSEFCPNRRCGFVHEFATCIDDLSEQNGGLDAASLAEGTYADSSLGKCRNLEAWHKKKRVHARWCKRDAWKLREMVAALREAHREGRYF